MLVRPFVFMKTRLKWRLAVPEASGICPESGHLDWRRFARGGTDPEDEHHAQSVVLQVPKGFHESKQEKRECESSQGSQLHNDGTAEHFGSASAESAFARTLHANSAGPG